MPRIFPMAPLGSAAVNTVRGLTAFLFIMMIPMVIAPWNVRWIIALVMVLAFVLLWRIMSCVGKVTFRIADGVLDVQGDFFSRRIPTSDLRLTEARRVDLRLEPALAPVVRIAGTALPGYQGGWFRLQSGEKGLVYLSDRSKAVCVPTTLGYTLLLTPDDPQGFLDAVRQG